ncbi:pyrroline-5-carboxylate reductase [Puteibacter caeruleilacunae]|nr:pyrroline-5-carboxylate reductase [Puteibacter caeruleilacunae]
MNSKKITIIGGGNLGGAIAQGLVKSGLIKAENITVTRRRLPLIENLREMGINTMSDNEAAVESADIIFLAIKPYQIVDILRDIKGKLSADKTLVSVVAGVGLDVIEKEIGSEIPLFRAMPNTAISLQESMTCISFNPQWSDRKDDVVKLFDQLGETAVIAEELMSAATVLGSCGIAFALRFIRAAMQGGIEIGFGAEMAQLITAQTVKGAAELVKKTKHHPEREIDKVTTPRGITISGLNEMEHKGFSSSLIQGLVTSFEKVEKEKK